MWYFSSKESINKVVNEVWMAVRTRLYNNYTMTKCEDDLKLPAKRNIKIFNNEKRLPGARAAKRIDVGIRVTSIW